MIKQYFMSTKKIILVAATLFAFYTGEAQVRFFAAPWFGYGPYGRPMYPNYNHRNSKNRQNYPTFKPYFSISGGYGFPNMDQYSLPSFYTDYSNAVTQTGPITGSIDYRFCRSTSIGLMVTHGDVSKTYFDNNTGNKDFTGSLDNWSVMINLMNYFYVNTDKVSPYIRTAIGANIWQQTYTNPDGTSANVYANLPDLAYQVSLGADFKIANHSAIFAEAGFGKYILQAGLKFKF